MFWLFGRGDKRSSSESSPSTYLTLKAPVRALIGELGGELLELIKLSTEELVILSPRALEPGSFITLYLDLSFGANEDPLSLKAIVVKVLPVGGPIGKRYELYLKPVIRSQREHVTFNKKFTFLLSALVNRGT